MEMEQIIGWVGGGCAHYPKHLNEYFRYLTSSL